jgi:hypothetical protein
VLVDCPRCGAPAFVVERFDLPSTDGPVAHLKLECSAGHWLTPLAERVPGALGARAGAAAPARGAHPSVLR